MPLYISRVQVKNFRNFKCLDLPLTRSTVIVGENKVGKTNLVYALRLALDPALPETSRALRAEDFWDGLAAPFSGNVVEVALEISGFDEDKEAQAALIDCLIGKKPMLARLTYQFRPRAAIEARSAGPSEYEYTIFGGSDERNQVGRDVRRWISLVALPALRDAEGDVQNWRRSPLRPLLEGLQIDAARLGTIAESLNEVTRELISEQPVAKLAAEITERINEMVGDVHGIDARLGLAPAAADQLLRSIRLFVDGDRFRQISEGSLGSANIIFLALLMQGLDARRSAKEIVSTILAIEEPEAHLHPQVQRLLFRYFLRRNHPVIVTTHSPNIASVAPIDSIVLLKGTKEGHSEGHAVNQISLTTGERDDLQRYIDVTRAEIVFAKGVILVEGPAEQFLLPAFARFLKDDGRELEFDRVGVSVCPVFGTDFAPYVKLLGSNGLRIPHVVITDGDPVEKDGAEYYAGIKRGARLVQDSSAKQAIEELIDKNEWSNARKQLAENNVFVGRSTLEIELLYAFAEAIKETYTELASSTKRAESFTKLIDEANNEGKRDLWETIVTRIESLGKGRFAQRLATKIQGAEPPRYIRKALERIAALVKA